MRKRIDKEKKKKTISVSIHPKLLELIKKNKLNKTKLIGKLLKDFFTK